MDVEFGELGGDPDLLDVESAHFAEVAAKIDAAVATLRKLTGLDGMRGEAVAALSRAAEEVAGQIALPKERYLQTGEALAAYSPALRNAQDAARVAAAHLAELEGAAKTTAHAAADAAQQLLLGAATMNPDDLEQAKTDAARAAHAAEHAAGELALWQRQWLAAQQEKAEAAARASARIVSVLAADGARLRDGVADVVGMFLHQEETGLAQAWHDLKTGAAGVGDWAVGVLKSSGFSKALKVMDWISAGLGIAALVLCWVPGLGQLLGAADGIAALLDAAGHLAQDSVEGRRGKVVEDVAFGLAGVFGGGALRVVAKNIASAARVTSTASRIVSTGRLSDQVTEIVDTVSSGGRLWKKLADAQNVRLVLAKAKALLPSWEDVGVIFKEGGKTIKHGSAEWAQESGQAVYRSIRDRSVSLQSVSDEMDVALKKFLGAGKEATADLGDGALSRPWKVVVGVAQSSATSFALHDHVDQVGKIDDLFHPGRKSG
ncbi:MAG: hypothetical protein FWD85_13060 [Microbacteriaceae bacterium]|nr:hypothetical protein [Microbacteriaceae bacterium]MCL2796218.1 hypothetical protein [Microbacteriaceae bacterium]